MRTLLALLVGALLVGPAAAQQPPPVTSVTTTAAAATLVLKAFPGNMLSVYASGLQGGTTGFLQILNATSAPGDGALTGCGTAPTAGCLMDCAPFSGGVAQIINNGGLPATFYQTGIVAVVSSSTTCFTKTTGTLTAFVNGKVQ